MQALVHLLIILFFTAFLLLLSLSLLIIFDGLITLKHWIFVSSFLLSQVLFKLKNGLLVVTYVLENGDRFLTGIDSLFGTLKEIKHLALDLVQSG